ncbi:hypothetical protein LMIY3S_01712 [Labrys miyagiensis]
MEPTRNLILVHSHGWQDIADFEAIRAYVEDIAPDIEVFIVSNAARSSTTRRKAAQRPSLVFSPLRLLDFRPERGRIYEGRVMSKFVEMDRLQAGGLPVPAYEEIRPDTALSPETYGPYVIVKPAHDLASWGQGVELQRTEDVRYRAPSDFPENHPGRSGPMMAQKYIDCGHAMTCRVLTLFGVPIFTYLREATRPLALEGLRAPYAQEDFMPVNVDLRISSTRDPDYLALAAAAFEAMPDIALQACDILRDKEGGLHLLEVNPGGGTWMFSSKFAPAYREALGVEDLTTEFDAFETCARLLVERTRSEAK